MNKASCQSAISDMGCNSSKVKCHFCAENVNFLGIHPLEKSEDKLEEILWAESGGKKQKIRNKQMENFSEALNQRFGLGRCKKNFYYMAQAKLHKQNQNHSDLGNT